MWAVMPCCMRTAACFPEGCEMLRCPDATRHALLCWEASSGARGFHRQADHESARYHLRENVHTERAAELQWRRAARESPPPPARLRFHII